MRIIGGTLSGRSLETPTGNVTRPMMDRMRETLFNVLMHRDWGFGAGRLFEDARVLDAFCGTGALAFEALSRGAVHATLLDQDAQALRIASANARSLGVERQTTVIAANTLAPPAAAHRCRVVFLAPPYHKKLVRPALLALSNVGWIAPGALIVVHIGGKEPLDLPDGYEAMLSRVYGDTALHFVTAAGPAPARNEAAREHSES
jgi:16S rRNA (guanine966-N2)-methyltransferase